MVLNGIIRHENFKFKTLMCFFSFLSSTQSIKCLGGAASFFILQLLFFDRLTTLNIGPSRSERLLPRPTNGVTVEGVQDLLSFLEVCYSSCLCFLVAVHVRSLFCGGPNLLALRSVHDRVI